MIFWISEEKARVVTRLARGLAGDGADLANATTALRKAAADLRATLTPHGIAI